MFPVNVVVVQKHASGLHELPPVGCEFVVVPRTDEFVFFTGKKYRVHEIKHMRAHNGDCRRFICQITIYDPNEISFPTT